MHRHFTRYPPVVVALGHILEAWLERKEDEPPVPWSSLPEFP